MNILMVIDSFGFDLPGGAGTILCEYAKCFRRAGHTVFVMFRRKNGKIPLRGEIDGLRYYTYDCALRNTPLFMLDNILKARDAFNDVIRDARIDLVHFHHPLPALGILWNGKSRGIPKICSFHAPWAYEYKSHKIIPHADNLSSLWFCANYGARMLVERAVVKSSDTVLVLSEYSKHLLDEAHPGNARRVEMVPGGIDTAAFAPTDNLSATRRSIPLPETATILLTIRRLVPRMGLENLLNAMPNILKANPNVILVIGGTGPLEAELKDLALKLDLRDNVRFTGFIEQEKLFLYYRSADLFILPTLDLEGFGLVTLEALASGTPVLGTAVGGTREILGRLDERMLFKDVSPEALAELINRFLASPEQLKALRAKCRDFVIRNYGWDGIISKLEQVYLKVIAKR